MENQVSLEMLLELPKTVLTTSEKESYYLDLLSDVLIKKYYYKELKKDLNAYIKKFNDMKYLYQHPKNYSMKSSCNYSHVVVYGINDNDKVGNYVKNKVDSQIWVNDIYFSILSLANKLTYKEAIYFIDTFFGNRTEEQISEKLCICRKTLQKIKKSCLVKMYIEFEFLEIEKSVG